MRSFDTNLLTALQATGIDLDYRLKITRRDGTVQGFTTCDKDLTPSGGVTYLSSPSFTLSVLKQEAGVGVNNIDFTSLLGDIISEKNLEATLYNRADFEFKFGIWSDLTIPANILQSGIIGEIQTQDSSFKFEGRGLDQFFTQQIVDDTSATCRWKRLGSPPCTDANSEFDDGHDIAYYRQTGKSVASVVSASVFTLSSVLTPKVSWTEGLVWFTASLNGNVSAVRREMKMASLASGTLTVTLQETFPFVIAVGDVATIEEGCDRTLATCKLYFNSKRYGGEPDIPIHDKVKEQGRK